MKKHIFDEKNGLHYTRHGDVYLPDLVYSENKYPPLGKYGMLRKTYLKENHKLLYSRMLRNDARDRALIQLFRQLCRYGDGMIPVVPALFCICEYPGVMLQAFFSPEIHDLQLVNELYTLEKNLDAEDLQVLIDTAKRRGKNN